MVGASALDMSSQGLIKWWKEGSLGRNFGIHVVFAFLETDCVIFEDVVCAAAPNSTSWDACRPAGEDLNWGNFGAMIQSAL